MSRAPGTPPRRGAGRRLPRRVIRVLTEGAVTEPDYLDLWRRQSPSVVVDINTETAGYAPLSRVQEARRMKRSQRRKDPDFDEIWCVFDVDDHPNLNSAIAEARDAGIEIAVSNPCFELWLVLHVEDQTTEVDRHTIQRRAGHLGLIEGKSIPEAAKGTILHGYESAKSRARACEKRHHLGDRRPGANPSSGVWRLIDSIRRDDSPQQ